MSIKHNFIVVSLVPFLLYGGMVLAAGASDKNDRGRFHKEVHFPFNPAGVPNPESLFHKEVHFNLVRLASNGAVKSIQLINTEAGVEVFTSYPYGVKFAAPARDDRVMQMKTKHLNNFLKNLPSPIGRAKPRKGPTTPGALVTGFANGLPTGWNESTGATPGQCLNYTINTPSNNVEHESFSSSDAASSTAEQIHTSATVTSGVDAFTASNTFSYSDEFQSSTNSSNEYYNIFSLYTLDTSVPSRNPLTSAGKAAGTSFSTLCGSKYMSSVPAGMVATISINYGSSSESSQTNVSESMKSSEGLDSVSAAVSTANSQSNSSSYFSFSMDVYGGGTQASADLNNAFAATNSDHEAYYTLCAAGSASDCTTFTSNMGSGATNALNSFNILVDDLENATSPDLSFFETFPKGVAGASTSGLVTTDIPIATNNDVLELYAMQLDDYLTLLNQIATLNNRVNVLQNLLTNTRSFNPTEFIDLLSYLERLEDTYNEDRITLLTNLTKCLKATKANVTTVCEPIINNTITNAHEWYATEGENPNFFAQQNTLALQYVGTYEQTNQVSYPMDVIYIDELPSLQGSNNEPSVLEGQAAFLSLRDRSNHQTYPVVNIMPLEPDMEISTNNLSLVGDLPTNQFLMFTIGTDDSQTVVSSTSEAIINSIPCTPTFDVVCAINYIPEGSDAFMVSTHDWIEGLFE